MKFEDYIKLLERLKTENELNRETCYYLIGAFDEANSNNRISMEELKILYSKLPLSKADLEMINV